VRPGYHVSPLVGCWLWTCNFCHFGEGRTLRARNAANIAGTLLSAHSILPDSKAASNHHRGVSRVFTIVPSQRKESRCTHLPFGPAATAALFGVLWLQMRRMVIQPA